MISYEDILKRYETMRYQIKFSGIPYRIMYWPQETRPFKVRGHTNRSFEYFCDRNFSTIERLESFINKMTASHMKLKMKNG